jgi:hypothetical protein
MDKWWIKSTRGQMTCYCPRKMLLPRRQITRHKLCFYYTCKFVVISIKYVITHFTLAENVDMWFSRYQTSSIFVILRDRMGGWFKKKNVFNRGQKGLKMSGAMSELSYQSIRTANQARESVEGWWQGQYEKGHALIYLSHILPGQITCHCPSQEGR